MSRWKLELNKDIYQDRMPYFHSIEERIAGYRNFYSEAGLMAGTMAPAQPLSVQTSPDIHAMASYFSCMLGFYKASGREYTFSKEGWRTRERAVPSAGAFHRHEFIEILYVAEGTFSQILLGKTEHFSQGSFVITDSRIEHADYFTGDDSVVLFLWISREFLHEVLRLFGESGPLQSFFYQTLEKTQHVQRYVHLVPGNVPPRSQAELSQMLEQLVREDTFSVQDSLILERGQLTPEGAFFEQNRCPAGQPLTRTAALSAQNSRIPGRQQLIEGSLLRLFHILSLYYSLQLHVSDKESHDDILFYELDRYLHANCGTVTIADLEKTFHYQRNYYNLLIRRYRGCSYMAYVQQLRMEKAAALLQSTDLPVKEIAQACGYDNTSHFYHLFERHYGQSPKNYQKSTNVVSDRSS